MISFKKTKRNTFGMIYGRERVNIFVSHELKFPEPPQSEKK